jgi:hypothetical protein
VTDVLTAVKNPVTLPSGPAAGHDNMLASHKGEENMRLATPVAAVLSATLLTAQTVRGVSTTEICIGQTMPDSGPVSALGARVSRFAMLGVWHARH